MKILQKSVTVNANPEKLWTLWTDEDEITKFFPSKAKIELKIGGAFEMYFLLDNPYGSQGSEGMKILSYLPERMLSFEWNAPPQFPEVRKEKTWVVIEFDNIGNNQTRVTLSQLGWKDGEQWNEVYVYFDNAWSYVLSNLKKLINNTCE